MSGKFGRCAFISLLCVVTSWNVSLAVDPVRVFVDEAKAIHEDDRALAGFVSENLSLSGSAVGLLLDASIDAQASGDETLATENQLLAKKIASLYQEQTGSTTLLDLAHVYENWTPEQISRRQSAKSIEAEQKRSAAYATKEQRLASIATLDEAKATYSDIGDARSVAIVWGTQGIVYFYLNDFDGQENAYNNALEARRKIEDRYLEGKTLNGLGSVNLKKGQYAKAVQFYRQAVELREEIGDLKGLGTSLTYMGSAYELLGLLVDARDTFERALVILEKSGDAQSLYDNLNNVGILYNKMGRIEASSQSFRRALQIAIESGNPRGEIKSRNNLARNLRLQYRYSESIAHLTIVESLLAQYPDPYEQTQLYQNQGVVYREVGDLEKANVASRAFLKAAQDIGDKRLQLDAMMDLGYLYREIKAYSHGLRIVEKMRETAEATGDDFMIRESAKLAASFLRLEGRYDEALAAWELAYEKDRASGAEKLILEDRLGMANIHALAGRLETAREIYADLERTVDRDTGTDFFILVNLGIAHTYESTEPDKSAEYYERVLTVLEDTRESLTGDELRSDFLSGTRRYYYEEIARFYARVSHDDPEGKWSAKAFETVERAKARGLLDLLQASMLSKESPEEAEMLDAMYRLDRNASDYREEHKKLSAQYEAARDRRVKSSLESLSAATLAGLEETQKTVPQNSVVLAYALGDSASLLWVIDGKGHELHELPNRDALQISVQRLRDALASPGKGDTALRKTARKLYRQLIEPAEPRLTKTKTIIVVPDGALFQIPFEVLLTGDPKEDAAWGELPFLARSYAPVYAPSVSIYVSLENSKKKAKHDLDLLAVGDPDFSTLAVRGRAALDPLPFTRDEVISISEHVSDGHKGILLGSDASEARLKSELRRSSPRLLHLATHGLIDPAEPAASSIALGADEESGEDGYLYTMEILALPLTADLVVLSACESATGKLSRSEGVVGLSRAFIASGANSIVASLWAVSDESTSVLMDEFYDTMLGKKRPAGEALNEARFALMDSAEHAHPFFWSPFIVIGSEHAPW